MAPILRRRRLQGQAYRLGINKQSGRILIKQKSKKKEDSVEVGTDYEQQRAKENFVQQHRNSKQLLNNNSCKVLHQ
jgi:hypothetical protein